MISLQNPFFRTTKQPFAMHFFLVTCPVTVPEILVQTEGSDY